MRLKNHGYKPLHCQPSLKNKVLKSLLTQCQRTPLVQETKWGNMRHKSSWAPVSAGANEDLWFLHLGVLLTAEGATRFHIKNNMCWQSQDLYTQPTRSPATMDWTRATRPRKTSFSSSCDCSEPFSLAVDMARVSEVIVNLTPKNPWHPRTMNTQRCQQEA